MKHNTDIYFFTSFKMKYVVIKIKDIKELLTMTEKEQLTHIMQKIVRFRELEKLKRFKN